MVQLAYAIDEAHDRDPEKSSTIKQLRKHKESMRRFRTIQKVTGKRTGYMSRIMAPRDRTQQASNKVKEWDPVDDLNTLKQRISERNEQHFKQAENDPFAYGHLVRELKDPAVLEDLLDGMWSTEHPMREVEESMKQLRRPEGLMPVDQTITTETIKAEFKRVKERTSSSTSGRHVGHYKAAATNEAISHIHASIISLCLKHGITLERWKKITDVMLLRIPGDLRLCRLRIIQLIEADFDQFLRIAFARPLAHQGED
jgi:hypothetical protein